MNDDFETLQTAYYQHLKTIDALKERLRLTDENLDSANQTNQALCKKLHALNAENEILKQMAKVVDDATELFEGYATEDDFIAFIASGETDFMNWWDKNQAKR